ARPEALLEGPPLGRGPSGFGPRSTYGQGMAHHPSPLDNDLIRRAIRFAEQAHRGEKRKGTESPYFVHPVAVATLLAHVQAPDELIAAGFLHDVVEDTDVTVAELRTEFGP